MWTTHDFLLGFTDSFINTWMNLKNVFAPITKIYKAIQFNMNFSMIASKCTNGNPFIEDMKIAKICELIKVFY